MSFLSSLLNALPGAVAQGLIWGLMAIGVYITFRILDVADLTVDGSLATGGARAGRIKSPLLPGGGASVGFHPLYRLYPEK